MNPTNTHAPAEYWIAGAAAGLAAGVTLMYLFDPERGKRRRALLADQASSKLRHAERELTGKVEDAVHRVQGSIHDVLKIDGNAELTDDLLRDRVRSRLGHLVPHASQINTEVRDGIVALLGTLSPPLDRSVLVNDLRSIPGVRDVRDLLVTPML